MEALKKLQQARWTIRNTKLKKVGYNTYSKYYYFTPEQISILVSNACEDLNLFNKFDLTRTDLGLMAKLEIIDLDSGKRTSFEIATEIPEIKATNVAQQLGGCVTYSERYLLQIAYDIKDNSLDLDSDKKPVKSAPSIPAGEEKPWLNDKPKASVITALKGEKPVKIGNLTFKDNDSIMNYVDNKYKISKEARAELNKLNN